jgi:hypothetical protein
MNFLTAFILADFVNNNVEEVQMIWDIWMKTLILATMTISSAGIKHEKRRVSLNDTGIFPDIF